MFVKFRVSSWPKRGIDLTAIRGWWQEYPRSLTVAFLPGCDKFQSWKKLF